MTELEMLVILTAGVAREYNDDPEFGVNAAVDHATALLTEIYKRTDERPKERFNFVRS